MPLSELDAGGSQRIGLMLILDALRDDLERRRAEQTRRPDFTAAYSIPPRPRISGGMLMPMCAVGWRGSQSPRSLATVSITQYVSTPESGVRSVNGMNSAASRTEPSRRQRINASAPAHEPSRNATIG